jgi:hypothetical protein
VISGPICSSSSLLACNQPFVIASVSFNLPTNLALLIIFVVTAVVSILFYFTLKAYRPKLRVILVLIRASYTLALLLVILDAALVRTREEPGRLLIIKSDSPMMNLEGADGGKARDDLADDISRGLSTDAKLREHFSIEQLAGSQSSHRDSENDESISSPAAVVNLTDTAEAAITKAQRIARLFAAPLFVLPVTARNGVPDVSVNFVDCAGTASLGIPVTVRATLYGRGMAGRSTVVKLSDEALALTSTVVHWKEKSETITVPLALAPRVEGLHRYTVRAETCDGEINSENNEISFSVEADKAERRVLFIENQPTWEGKFIRRALEENRAIVIDYFAQVSRSASLTQQQTQSPAGAQSIIGDFKKLAAYDCVIIGPMDSSAISGRAAGNLTAFVERRGGGLVILGSNDFSGSILSTSSPLIHLSPAQVIVRQRPDAPQSTNLGNPVIGSQSQSRGAGASIQDRAVDRVVLVPTEEGREVFRMADSDKPIESMGPLAESYAQVRSLKAGAFALAIDGSRKQTDAPTLIAAQPYGYGRTLLFAPSDSWKIALAESAENKGAFALLWQNLVLWTAEGAEPASSIRLRSGSVESGDTVRAYLVARDDSFNPVAQLSLKGALELDGSERAGHTVKLPLTITNDPGVPGVYELSSPASGEGNALLSVAIKLRGGGEQALNLPFSVYKNRAAWRESPSVHERLRGIARASGGELFTPDEIELLKSRLVDLPRSRRAVNETRRVRNSVALAFLLPVLMSLEYLLRKRNSTG